MVVQTDTVSKNEDAIELIEIPENLPKEIIENDSLLALETNLNHLEDKVVVAARSLLSLTTEMKTQITEIERLENNVICMHDFISTQNDRIFELEKQVEEIHNTKIEIRTMKIKPSTGFWSKLFSRN